MAVRVGDKSKVSLNFTVLDMVKKWFKNAKDMTINAFIKSPMKIILKTFSYFVTLENEFKKVQTKRIRKQVTQSNKQIASDI